MVINMTDFNTVEVQKNHFKNSSEVAEYVKQKLEELDYKKVEYKEFENNKKDKRKIYCEVPRPEDKSEFRKLYCLKQFEYNIHNPITNIFNKIEIFKNMVKKDQYRIWITHTTGLCGYFIMKSKTRNRFEDLIKDKWL